MADTFACPSCDTHLKRSAQIVTGVRVQCPRCNREFTVPPEDAAHRDQRLQDRPTAPRTGPEYDEDTPPRPVIGGKADLSGGFPLDIGAWMGAAQQRWGHFLGPAIGFLLIAGVLFIAYTIAIHLTVIPLLAPSIGPFAAEQVANTVFGILIQSALIAGFPYAAVRALRRERWSFADFFAGFAHYGSVMLFALITNVLTWLCAAPMGIGYYLSVRYVPGPFGPVPDVNPEMALAVLLPSVLVCLPLVIYVTTRLEFGGLLILDQNMSATEAIAGSWRMTRGKVLGLFGFNLLLAVIAFAGALACGIGLLFALPFIGLCYAAAYLFATRQLVGFDGRRARVDAEDAPPRFGDVDDAKSRWGR